MNSNRRPLPAPVALLWEHGLPRDGDIITALRPQVLPHITARFLDTEQSTCQHAGSQVCVGASNSTAGAAVHALQRPLGTLHGVEGAACGSRKQRSVHRGLRRRDGQVDHMVGLLGMAWRSGRCCLEGYAALQVTVYWGPGVCVAVLGSVWWPYRGTAAVLGSRTVGTLRSRIAVLGCPPDPSNTSGGMQGHPLVPWTNQRDPA